ncbi:MAG: CDGSH iron-sulfur domain-containing protein [Deltaproteobacteria bacterium]|nr:CDGSH iron-sulfur domain-containing protein [Acidimicrobiia bacterium]MBM4296958.1 CDGSH iron-sulfur domain-containing protein [Deltaproteobacteria bacterium]
MNDDAASPRNLPISPQKGPYAVQVEEGRQYAWCSCGLSATQPWCDGAHRDTGFEPVIFVAPLSGVFYMCGCKASDNKPYCFGNCTGNNRRSDSYSIF